MFTYFIPIIFSKIITTENIHKGNSEMGRVRISYNLKKRPHPCKQNNYITYFHCNTWKNMFNKIYIVIFRCMDFKIKEMKLTKRVKMKICRILSRNISTIFF